jgi:hypothetical protein
MAKVQAESWEEGHSVHSKTWKLGCGMGLTLKGAIGDARRRMKDTEYVPSWTVLHC